MSLISDPTIFAQYSHAFPDFEGKIAIVTGATRGLGAAFSRMLARCGAHIIAVGRSVSELEALDDQIQKEGGTATLTPLDLTDHAALDRFGEALYTRWGRVDFLIANAARLGALSPVTHLEPAQWDALFSVNVTAHWRLLRAIDVLLRQAEHPRVVAVTSSVARTALPFWGAYAASKAALETFIRVYAAEMRNTKLRANLFDPGRMRTRMRAQAMPGENPETLPLPETIVLKALPLFLPELQETGRIFEARTGMFL